MIETTVKYIIYDTVGSVCCNVYYNPDRFTKSPKTMIQFVSVPTYSTNTFVYKIFQTNKSEIHSQIFFFYCKLSLLILLKSLFMIILNNTHYKQHLPYQIQNSIKLVGSSRYLQTHVIQITTKTVTVGIREICTSHIPSHHHENLL